ncbi:hypothetical protein [Nostocoides sp. F2B08]|nr:hypothetical protein [Tetrasphaera sp. F2B08]
MGGTVYRSREDPFDLPDRHPPFIAWHTQPDRTRDKVDESDGRGAQPANV